MSKPTHEIRDPIHVFVRLSTPERRLIDSRPLQRLRHVHQLALTYLVYPGATHRRFEHALGTLELTDRLFSTVTASHHHSPRWRGIFPRKDELPLWRQIVRLAAVCHDVGHLPFSHAAETSLLPAGMSHEDLTWDMITGEELALLWAEFGIPLDPTVIARIAVGPAATTRIAARTGTTPAELTPWEAILSEMITGDVFGADRMDYLLRDAHHTGVGNGRFDHYRLIDTLRILPETDVPAAPPKLGIEAGGLRSAEAMLLARYFMYSQVYYHPVRRAYNLHLREFLQAWLPTRFSSSPISVEQLLNLADDDVTVAMRAADGDSNAPGHDAAVRILRRKHYRVLYEGNPIDNARFPGAAKRVHAAAVQQFGGQTVRFDRHQPDGTGPQFPVRSRDGRIVASTDVSTVMSTSLPQAGFEYVFVVPEIIDAARAWLAKEFDPILTASKPLSSKW